LEHVHQGVFAATLPVTGVPDYRLAVTYPAPGTDGAETLPETVTDDPYRHLPTLGEVDLHLIAEGRHEQLWQVLGAHVSDDAVGTAFAVWAPNALGVRVIGDFNHWDGRAHPMRSLGGSGVWELFVPEAGPGTRYKYDICGPDGSWHSKADPMASLAERPPATASVVYDSSYEWGDRAWLAERAGRDPGDVDVMSWLYVSVDDDPAAARTAVSKMVLASLITSRPILDRIGIELPPALRDRLDAQGWRYPRETPEEAAALLPDHIVDAFALHGTPAQVRKRLDVIRDCGINHVAFVLFPSSGNSTEALARRIALEIVSS